MLNESSRLSTISEINACKDEINRASKNILSKLRNPSNKLEIDSDILDVLTAIGKIGTLSANPRDVSNWAASVSDMFIRLDKMNSATKLQGFRIVLYQACLTAFLAKNTKGRFVLKLPDITALKIGT